VEEHLGKMKRREFTRTTSRCKIHQEVLLKLSHVPREDNNSELQKEMRGEGDKYRRKDQRYTTQSGKGETSGETSDQWGGGGPGEVVKGN